MAFTRKHPIQLNDSGKAIRSLSTLSLTLATLIYQPGLIFFLAILWLFWIVLHLEGKRSLESLAQLQSEWEVSATPRICIRGQQLEVILILKNPHSFSLVGLQIQLRAQEGLSHPLYFNLLPHERLKIPVTLEGRDIGDVFLWGIELSWSGPLHTYQLLIQRSLPLKYHVTPNLAIGRSLYLQAATAQGDGRGKRERTPEGNFQELRAYQKGDELKRVAWRASAKSGKLLSKVYEEPRQRRVLIALDVGPTMRALLPSGERALTYAIEVAYSEITRARDTEVGLVLFDHRLIGELSPSAQPSSYYAQLLQYAAQVYESDCLELDQQHLIALLGEYLYFSGIDSARLGGFEHIRSGVDQLILGNEYWSEAIDHHINEAILSTYDYPRGLSSHHWRTRYLSACLMFGLHLPYRQSSRYGSTAAVFHALIKKSQAWGITELLILSHADRLEVANDLFPLRSWAKRGGQLTWCDFATPLQNPQELPDLPKLINPRSLVSSISLNGKVLQAVLPNAQLRGKLNMPPARFGDAYISHKT